MSNPATKIEILYPEHGNQGGDNGNALPEACLQKRTLCTPHAATPTLLKHAISNHHGWYDRSPAAYYFALYLTDRLAELADQGVPMLFCGQRFRAFYEKIVNPDGS